MALFKSLFLYVAILFAGIMGIFVALPSEESRTATPADSIIAEEEAPVHTEEQDLSPDNDSAAAEPTPESPPEIAILPQAPTVPVPEVAPTTPTAPAIDPFEGLAEAFSQIESQPQPPEAPVPPPAGSLNEMVRNAVVNIVCTTAGSGPFNPISASGVMVHPSGVILTNAHVAQYLLLKNYPSQNFVECTVRTGSPASPKYKAELLFIPPSWVIENASKIKEQSPRGNGENDYALLRITGGVSTLVEVPHTLPYVPIALDDPVPGSQTLLVGYPAGFLGGITVQKELYAVSANASIGQIFTYGGNTPDLFSIGGTVVAQQGSSGGAVVRNDGALIGLIVTSSEAATTGERDLRALSTAYIVRSFAVQSGVALSDFLSSNLEERAKTFNVTVAPTLTQTLIHAINQ